jgi:hypothetical protein
VEGHHVELPVVEGLDVQPDRGFEVRGGRTGVPDPQGDASLGLLGLPIGLSGDFSTSIEQCRALLDRPHADAPTGEREPQGKGGWIVTPGCWSHCRVSGRPSSPLRARATRTSLRRHEHLPSGAVLQPCGPSSLDEAQTAVIELVEAAEDRGFALADSSVTAASEQD